MIALVTDQGGKSGYTLIRSPESTAERFSRRAVLEYGVARNNRQRLAVVLTALRYAGNDPLKVLAVYEDHSGMPLARGTKHDTKRAVDSKGKVTTRSSKSIIGQGANLGRWLERWDDAGIPEDQQVGIEPKVWRERVLGKATAKKQRDDAKSDAVLYAAALLNGERVSDDTAESLAIAAYVFGEWLTPGRPAPWLK